MSKECLVAHIPIPSESDMLHLPGHVNQFQEARPIWAGQSTWYGGSAYCIYQRPPTVMPRAVGSSVYNLGIHDKPVQLGLGLGRVLVVWSGGAMVPWYGRGEREGRGETGEGKWHMV